MLQEFLARPLAPWQDGSGAEQDIILSSNAYVYRNLSDHVFPARDTAAGLASVLEAAEKTLTTLNGLAQGTYESVHLDQLTDAERYALVERHLVTARQIAIPEQRGLLLREDGGVTIAVNDENHFTIQSNAAGLAVKEAWETASQVDDAMESVLNFAFRDDVGYMTADPATVGTGLQACVIMHLPALVQLKRWSRIVRGITKAGFAVRGLYGGPAEAGGNVFCLTNVVTLGVEEERIIDQLEKIAVQIAREERTCRETLLTQGKNYLKDRLCRSYGILSHAWLLSAEEAVTLLSDLRLGIDLKIINERPLVFEALLSMLGTGTLAFLADKKSMTEEEIDMMRAAIIRQSL